MQKFRLKRKGNKIYYKYRCCKTVLTEIADSTSSGTSAIGQEAAKGKNNADTSDDADSDNHKEDASDNKSVEPAKVENQNSGSSFFMVEAGTWKQVRDFCLMQGGDLASIHSAAEAGQAALACPHERCYIGLTRDRPGQPFFWTDGSPVEYTAWDDNQPQPRETVVVWTDGAGGSWHEIKRLRQGVKVKHAFVRNLQGNLTPTSERANTLADYFEQVKWQVRFPISYQPQRISWVHPSP